MPTLMEDHDEEFAPLVPNLLKDNEPFVRALARYARCLAIHDGLDPEIEEGPWVVLSDGDLAAAQDFLSSFTVDLVPHFIALRIGLRYDGADGLDVPAHDVGPEDPPSWDLYD